MIYSIVNKVKSNELISSSPLNIVSWNPKRLGDEWKINFDTAQTKFRLDATHQSSLMSAHLIKTWDLNNITFYITLSSLRYRIIDYPHSPGSSDIK